MDNNYKNARKNFFVRILMPTFLTIGLFIAVFFALIIPQFETAILDRKREMIKELTNSACSILEKFYKEETGGKLSRIEAQRLAVEQIQSLRYGEKGKDYFWITDYSPIMIMHPYRKELNKKDLSDFRDSHGKKLFVEMADTAKKNGSGFVDYMWQWKDDSTKVVPKLSYVKSFSGWRWIVGTGIYIEDVK
ncbi:MAG: cache domain-containing protein, partial [bacterium]|nr:cache domain-containing protein [bacterium]